VLRLIKDIQLHFAWPPDGEVVVSNNLLGATITVKFLPVYFIF